MIEKILQESFVQNTQSWTHKYVVQSSNLFENDAEWKKGSDGKTTRDQTEHFIIIIEDGMLSVRDSKPPK